MGYFKARPNPLLVMLLSAVGVCGCANAPVDLFAFTVPNRLTITSGNSRLSSTTELAVPERVWLRAASVSKSGRIATAWSDGAIRIYDSTLSLVEQARAGEVRGMAWSNDEKRLAAVRCEHNGERALVVFDEKLSLLNVYGIDTDQSAQV